MSVPDYQSLMQPLLRCAVRADRPVTILELQDVVAQDLGLDEAQLAERLRSGKQTVFHNRLHWAKQYMTRAGLLESTRRGQFQVTAAGRNLLAEDLPLINNRVLAKYPEFVGWLKSRGIGSEADTAVFALPAATADANATTPEERIEAARRELEASLKADLLDRVRAMPPSEFEGLIIDLLVRMGYGQGGEEMAQALGGSGDGGVDGVVHQDPLGLDRVYIQAKRYREGNSVGPDAINSFIGALNIKRANKGLFVTASSYTKQAREHAERSTTHVVLIDGDRLAELMLRHGVGVIVRHTIEIKTLDEGFFGD
ncbi:restriction endonuclease [Brevundimonas sp. DWR2-3-1b1]|uniref:restriction endonuclease n=1 Tax=Brevundimonas sp. DWR2-3-1b1 TaxID=2804641 RepID=UPI003CEB6B68